MELDQRVLVHRDSLADGLTFDVNGFGPYYVSLNETSFLSVETYRLLDADRNVVAQLERPAVILNSYRSHLEYGGKRFKLRGKGNPVVALGRFKVGIAELDLWFDLRWSMMSTEINCEPRNADHKLVAVAVLLQFMLIKNWNQQ